MKELALHLLDIAENSVAAQARNNTLEVFIDEDQDRLLLTVMDDGIGMKPDQVASMVDPFFTTRKTRKVGLGLPLLKSAAEACEGSLSITSDVGVGTQISALFRLGHIDRMPIGDLPNTCLQLIIGYPDVHWIFRFTSNNTNFTFDDAPFKQALENIPLSDPWVIAYLRDTLETGFVNLRNI